MNTMERTRRRLSAILSADVAGYSLLMAGNEVATVDTLTQYRDIMSDNIQKFNGRVVDSPGDNLLAEFGSTVDAVECAVNMQKCLLEENTALPENRKMQFRVGINLGDVIMEEDRIYGDGINIAARIESLCEPGGVSIARSVYDQVQNKLDVQFDYAGEHTVKNIAEPVRIYNVIMDAGEERLPAGAEGGGNENTSIIVLPFINMSGDTDQEYFSDGLTEDLITDLSKISNLFVIARNSAFTYKGKAVNIQDIGRDMGVKYALEGSVRKAGQRVRITAQLIDTASGGHIWADRYDRNMDDIFALQDDVTQQIVSVLAVKVGEKEKHRIYDRDTDNVAAYDYFLRGLEYYNRFSPEGNFKARELFEKAIDLDTGYTMAYAKYGWTYLTEWMMGWSEDERNLERARELAIKAISTGDTVGSAYCLLGHSYLWKKQHDKAIAMYEELESMNYGMAESLSDYASVLNFCGRPEEAIELLQKAIRLDPLFPVFNSFNLGHAYYLVGQYQDAITHLREALVHNADFFPARFFLVATYVAFGNLEEAQAEAARVQHVQHQGSETSLDAWSRRLPYKDPDTLANMVDALKQAGFS
jgi:adenylate cyclase